MRRIQTLNRKLLPIFLFSCYFWFTSIGKTEGNLEPLGVVEVVPAPNMIGVPLNTRLMVKFSQSIVISDLRNTGRFGVFGSMKGKVSGKIELDSTKAILTFVPEAHFLPGEQVTASLFGDFVLTNNTVQKVGYVWQFIVQAPNSSGLFSTGIAIPVAAQSEFVAAADLNGDQRLDLVVGIVTPTANFLISLVHDNEGFLQRWQSRPISAAKPFYLADFNGDGAPDLMALLRSESEFYLYINDGTGSFGTEPFAKISALENLRSAYISDLDADGDLDVAVCAYNNSGRDNLWLYNNDGNGHLGLYQQLNAGQRSQCILGGAWDSNRLEGTMDLVVSANRNIAIFTNDGTGSMSQFQSISIDVFDDESGAAADFNNDGFCDVIFTNRAEVAAEWGFHSYLNDGLGKFTIGSFYNTGALPGWTLATDLNNDKAIDIITCNDGSNDLTIYHNDGNNFVAPVTKSTFSAPVGIAAADFNQDNTIDLVVAHKNSDSLLIYYTSIAANTPPESPKLDSPANGNFSGSLTPGLGWLIPTDEDGDSLHFIVSLKIEPDSTSEPLVFSSEDYPTAFEHVGGVPLHPPVPSGRGFISFRVPVNLTNDRYGWQVRAKDLRGAESQPSERWFFTVDNLPPRITAIEYAGAQYHGNWFKNDHLLTAISTTIRYTEKNPVYAILDAGKLAAPIKKDKIPAGQNVSIDFILTISPDSVILDGQYPIKVTIQDSVPTITSMDSWLGLDGTAPVTCVMQKLPEQVNNLRFTVRWNPGNDGNGSGLSGKYDIYYHENNDAWQLWLDDTEGLSAVFDRARDQFRYGFQAITRDHVGNIEQLSSTEEAWTVVKLEDDFTPPPAPMDLRADGATTSSPWKNISTFTITWKNPDDPSQVARALYKLGFQPPVHNHDVTDSIAATENGEIQASVSGGQWLYLWLRDGAGNADAKNYAAVKLRWDDTPPIIEEMTFTNPAWNDNWFNPHFGQDAVFSINYTEVHPAKLAIDTGILADSSIFKPPQQKPTSITIPVQNRNDGFYDITVSLEDSAGNAAVAVKQLKIDGTAPINTMASSPHLSSKLYFSVKWLNSLDGEFGSGLSGEYDAWVSRDNFSWEPWLHRYNGEEAVYGDEPGSEPTRQGQTYYFKVGAWDNVGNHEQPVTAQCSTKIDTMYADFTPPAPPQNLMANGRRLASPWTNNPIFTITWTNPPDSSGIEWIYFKSGSPAPKDNGDYTGFDDASDQHLEITISDLQYGDWLYLWLEDSVGNSNIANRDSVFLRYDATKPVLNGFRVNRYQARDENIYWFNPDSADLATVEISFDEYYPAKVELFNDSLFTGSPQIEFDSTVNHMTYMAIRLDSLDGRFNIKMTIVDSASNYVDSSFTIGIDGTAPAGAIAYTDSMSRKVSIPVFWQGKNRGDDGNGSGLSGIYSLQVRKDNGSWQELPEKIVGESVVYENGEDGHQYDFEVAAYDRVGNFEGWQNLPEASTRVNLSRIDEEAPGAPRQLLANGANPGPWNNTNDFKVTWQEPLNDFHNIIQAFYTLAGNPDTLAFPVTYSGNDTLLVTTSGEGVDTLFVWLQDSSNNVNSDSCAAVALRVDKNVPVIDSIKVLNPDFKVNWLTCQHTASAEIVVYFTEVNPDSAIGLITGPYQFRLTGHVEPDSQWAVFSMPIKESKFPDGAYLLTATLFDQAGNNSRSDSLDFYLDSTGPEIYHDAISRVNQGDSIVITARISDNFYLDSTAVNYKLGGRRDFQRLEMFKVGDSTFTASLPVALTDSARGIDYYIFASDGLNTTLLLQDSTKNRPFSIQVYYPGIDQQGLKRPEPQPAGTEQNGYRMVSIPLSLEDARAYALLEDDFGKEDKTKWRFFKYFPQKNEYAEYPNTGDIEAGQAYWLITSRSGIYLDTGPGTTLRTDRNFVIRLRKGWNDIGNPFNFTVATADIWAATADTMGIMGPYTYDGTWRIPIDINMLRPWDGYSFYSDQDDRSLVIPAIEASKSLTKIRKVQANWLIALHVRCQDAMDLSNYIGVTDDAASEYDRMDYLEPPTMGSYVSLYFPHPNWKKWPGNYTTDFRDAASEREEWEFNITSDILDEQIQLSVATIQPIPEDFNVLLYDIKYNKIQNLREDSTCAFFQGLPGQIHNFKLVVAKDMYLEEHETDQAETPKATRLIQNYPNPFNSKTTVEYEVVEPGYVELVVYNLLAQKVCTLFAGPREPGFYKIQWDGRHDNGEELGTGVYLLRLETKKQRSIRKLIYIK